MEELQQKILTAQAELSAKIDLEIQRFLSIRGFKDRIDLKAKGFDLIIEKKQSSDKSVSSGDKYVISEQMTLKLVKVEQVEFIDCNIKINL